MEMEEMISKAKAISSLINQNATENSDSNDNNSNNGMQAEKILAMMQMMKLFSTQEKNETSENIQEEKKKYYIQEFDEQLQTPALKTIKAAIPYLEYEYQKNLGIFVKLIEMDSLMKRYNTITALSQEKKNNWQKAMLKDVSDQLEGRDRGLMQMMIKLIDIKEIMDSLKENKNE